MIVKSQNPSLVDSGPIVIKCPGCGQGGTFTKFQNLQDLHLPNSAKGFLFLGHRQCPNPSCQAHVFFVRAQNGDLLTYPSLRVDFDSNNIPQTIKNALEEAISCHANGCFMAAGIMVRRTLEELCSERGVSGGNLKQRLNSLQDKVILPPELFEAMDELRILGNDAAHIESKEYDQIGNNEIEVAIELTKEILKAIYQMNSLVNKLKSLKKQQ